MYVAWPSSDIPHAGYNATADTPEEAVRAAWIWWMSLDSPDAYPTPDTPLELSWGRHPDKQRCTLTPRQAGCKPVVTVCYEWEFKGVYPHTLMADSLFDAIRRG
jgi:hypothetical protein